MPNSVCEQKVQDNLNLAKEKDRRSICLNILNFLAPFVSFAIFLENGGLCVWNFLIPAASWIVYLVDEKPIRARSALVSAIFGYISVLVFLLFSYVTGLLVAFIFTLAFLGC